MDQNDEQRKAFLAEINEHIKDQYRKYRIEAGVRTGLMILIALAGFFTGAEACMASIHFGIHSSMPSWLGAGLLRWAPHSINSVTRAGTAIVT